MAGWTGLEPAAFRVTGGRYNQLNYHPARQNLNEALYVIGIKIYKSFLFQFQWIFRAPLGPQHAMTYPALLWQSNLKTFKGKFNAEIFRSHSA